MIPKSKCLDQLLFVIKSKNSIDKTQVIKVISQAYNIIDKNNLIFITVLIGATANNINRNILYITFGINTWKTKKIVRNQ